ncbi:phosphotransferase enzyme family protein [Paenibacillus sp. FSL K6-2862]|uniref:phosphotransferase enzyme family protein n=1 Tax=Paenibacillus sp. FSL K6-2862 TaxID=2921484 RepID=UPI0030F5B877
MNERILLFLNKTYPIHFYAVETITNEMYRCQSNKGNFFLRITNYKTFQEQLEEVTWTHFLFTQGVGVPEVISSNNDLLIEKITIDEEKLAVLFQSASGIHLPRSKWDQTAFRLLGQQMGKMHRVSKGYLMSEKAVHINHWYESDEYDFLKYIPAEEKSIQEIAHDVVKRVKELPQGHSTYGLIHGDLWLENILIDNESKLTMIDFQDCEKHFYAYDLAVPIYSALEFSYSGGGNIRDYEQSITKALIEGYKEENDLSSEVLMQLPLFLKLKELFEYNLMHMYWNFEELSEEQVRILNLYRIRIENMHA